MKKLAIGCCITLSVFMAAKGYGADIAAQGKIVSLNPCKHSSTSGYNVVTLDDGNSYRLGAIGTGTTIDYTRKDIAAILLLAYERDYTISLSATDSPDTRCGVTTLGGIHSLKLEKSLN